jgi:hypothetical protein
MVGWLVNIELARIWMEAVLAYLKVLSRHIRLEGLRVTGLWAEFRIRDFPDTKQESHRQTAAFTH